jgi:hypothetical protein
MKAIRTSAEQAADEAIARVARPLSDEEKLDALVLVGEIACEMEYFTTDDVGFIFPSNVDRRASGYVMRAAAREGFISATDRWNKSLDVTCHARPKRIWQSKLIERKEGPRRDPLEGGT